MQEHSDTCISMVTRGEELLRVANPIFLEDTDVRFSLRFSITFSVEISLFLNPSGVAYDHVVKFNM